MSLKDPLDFEELLTLEQKYGVVLDSEPESNTFCILADVQYRLGKLDKATGVLIRGLGYNRNNVTARFLLGKIYYERWLIDQAKKEMEKVLGLSPDHLGAAKLLSEIFRSEENLPKALETLEAAYVFHTDDVETIEKINRIKSELSEIDAEASRKVFETPVATRKVSRVELNDKPADEPYTETMLKLYIKQGLFDKARETIEHLYENREEKNAAIDKLEKTKLNKMNAAAGFGPRD